MIRKRKSALRGVFDVVEIHFDKQAAPLETDTTEPVERRNRLPHLRCQFEISRFAIKSGRHDTVSQRVVLDTPLRRFAVGTHNWSFRYNAFDFGRGLKGRAKEVSYTTWTFHQHADEVGRGRTHRRVEIEPTQKEDTVHQ